MGEKKKLFKKKKELEDLLQNFFLLKGFFLKMVLGSCEPLMDFKMSFVVTQRGMLTANGRSKSR